MPHDKAQLNAAVELQSRQWIYCNESMRWIKANPSSHMQKRTGKSSSR